MTAEQREKLVQLVGEERVKYKDYYCANLRSAILEGANLEGANLRGAKGLRYQIPQDGSLTVWGKKSGVLVKLQIPAKAKRTACIINRKCRAEYAKCLWTKTGEPVTVDKSAEGFGVCVYTPGEVVRPHEYSDDPRIDCAPGIHFWLTREEAEEWSM